MEAINRRSVIWGLEQLASRSEQERLWLSDGSSGEVSSFTESICGVFDDGGVSRALDTNKLPHSLAAKFRELSKYIDLVPQNVSPQIQIDHPAVAKIAKISLELKEILEEK